MYKFIRPKMIKKDAETELPMIPPTRLNASNLLLMADAVAATTKDVTMTMLEIRKFSASLREVNKAPRSAMWPKGREMGLSDKR